jgi:hypothetical protein
MFECEDVNVNVGFVKFLIFFENQDYILTPLLRKKQSKHLGKEIKLFPSLQSLINHEPGKKRWYCESAQLSAKGKKKFATPALLQ